MLKGLDFKTMMSNSRGVWIRRREINWLVNKGIITVDEEALRKYADEQDEEFDEWMRDDSLEAGTEEMLGRKLNEADRMMLEAGKRAMRGE